MPRRRPVWARMDVVPTYRDEAVVLRTHKLGEADRIVTVLSRTHGKLRAVARGVRRTKSKFGARLEPFSHVDLQFATGRSLDVITEAVTRHAYSEPLGVDYASFTAGQVMLETADRLVTEEGQPSVRQFHLLVGGLHALTQGTSDGPRPPTMIMDAYLLRAIATAGFAPSLTECAVCGRAGPHQFFSPESGGMVCPGCRPPRSAMPPQGTVGYLSALLCGDWAATASAPEPVQRAASGLIAAFASWHLDRGLRTLSYVERLDQPDRHEQ